jgi:hypothetical protein
MTADGDSEQRIAGGEQKESRRRVKTHKRGERAKVEVEVEVMEEVKDGEELGMNIKGSNQATIYDWQERKR